MVLVPYVGQLLEMRRALQCSNLRVFVSERDENEILRQQGQTGERPDSLELVLWMFCSMSRQSM